MRSMLKIIILSFIAGLLFTSSLFARNINDEFLQNLVESLAAVLMTDDINGFQKLCAADLAINGRKADTLSLERVFALLKDVQAKYDYKEILKDNRRHQKVTSKIGEFYLGGHKYNHLTLKLVKIKGVWVIVSFDQCL